MLACRRAGASYIINSLLSTSASNVYASSTASTRIERRRRVIRRSVKYGRGISQHIVARKIGKRSRPVSQRLSTGRVGAVVDKLKHPKPEDIVGLEKMSILKAIEKRVMELEENIFEMRKAFPGLEWSTDCTRFFSPQDCTRQKPAK